MIDIDSPLDLDDPAAAQFLGGLQGNIIKGHGRDFTAHLVLKMTADRQTVRSWIAKFAGAHVTTAAIAKRQTLAWRAAPKDANDKGEPFAMFLLAPDGYRHLGFSDAELPAPRSDKFTNPVHSQYFTLGMKGQSSVPAPGRHYNDPPPAQWDGPYRQQIHAMVLLADDDRDRLDRSVEDITASLAGVFELLTTERGQVLREKFPRGKLDIEHFGFQDGVSQPLMIKQDIAQEVARRGNTHWNPAAPLWLALVEEPGAAGGFGSFMVFRKLEQNVKAFWDTLEQLSRQSGVPAEDLGAMAVGRRRDGTPAVPTTTIDPSADFNDFHYSQDVDGAKCPFHAHIRKTNPRGDIPNPELERARRIVRRGITYGDRPDLSVRPETGMGLLFMCFQSNLDQFAIQQEGSDANDFINPGVGVDAVIGQNSAAIPQTWPSTGTVKFTMANLVKMKGGEYFFAPSMGFLKGLATS
ncbi:Dyp-type peroxidase [uncultured Bradyrhizobium sp.]|uniref:Dyp-type peroxidase n=1 Tax=uncultured Bradyrhizobium sp. TaxID=199684 RepID=UPI0035CBB2EB